MPERAAPTEQATAADQAAVARRKAALQLIWQQAQRGVDLRIAAMEAVTTAMGDGCAGPGAEAAAAAAHKLAGSCASFGFHEASELARQLEALFSAPGISPAEMGRARQHLVALRGALTAPSTLDT